MIKIYRAKDKLLCQRSKNNRKMILKISCQVCRIQKGQTRLFHCPANLDLSRHWCIGATVASLCGDQLFSLHRVPNNPKMDSQDH